MSLRASSPDFAGAQSGPRSLDPVETQTHSAAVARARSLAGKRGAIAFSRTSDPDIAEFARQRFRDNLQTC